MASLDTAIRLVTQAVSQDTARNYEEAARCYREAIALFRSVSRARGVSKRVRAAIDDKTALYEARLRKIDRHLLSKADLSKLFREVVATYSEEERRGKAKNSDGEDDDGKSDSSGSSGSSAVLGENPALQKGLEVLTRAKREDARGHFPEALHFYEQGAGQLLDAVRRGLADGEGQEQAVRIKCLLVHDRCELIRNHLEHGAPLKQRKESLDSFESSLEGSPAGGCSPVPLCAEDEALLMEEIRSQASASVAGSTHSLYPMCVEIKRPASGLSGHSDFNMVNVSVAQAALLEEEPAPAMVPLANLDKELNLSALSINSRISRQTAASISASVAAVAITNRDQSIEDIVQRVQVVEVQQHAAPSLDEDGILVVDEHGRLTDLSCGSFGEERDRNVTELTMQNSGVGSDLYKQYLEDRERRSPDQEGSAPASSPNQVQDSGSDSGFSDPSQDTVQSKSPAFSEGRKSHLSDIDSLDIVPSLPPNEDEAASSSSSSSTPRTPTLLVRRQRTRRQQRSGTSSRTNEEEDDLQVLSEEHVVVDHGRLRASPTASEGSSKRKSVRLVSPEVYRRARPSVREEYIPPRAHARRVADRHQPAEDGDGSGVNKGCYYFMACLDSFWIL